MNGFDISFPNVPGASLFLTILLFLKHDKFNQGH